MEVEPRMNLKPLILWGSLIIGLMLIFSLIAWLMIPTGQPVPIHWGLDGQPDNWASKTTALLVTPLIALVTLALMLLLTRIEPRRQHLRLSMKAYTVITIGLLCFLFLANALIAFAGMAMPVKINIIMPVSLGALFMLLGNYLGKFRSNFFAGIRTPWTLSSDLSWDKTHRIGGKLFMLIGAILIICVFKLDSSLWLFLMVAELLSTTVLLAIFSYLIWRSDPDRRGENGSPISSADPKRLKAISTLAVSLVLVLAGVAFIVSHASKPAANLAQRAKEVVLAQSKGQFTLAEHHFDQVMKTGLPPEKLETAWNGMVTQYGAYQGIEGMRTERCLPFTAVYVATQFGKSVVDIKVVFSTTGAISGLWLTPHTE